MELIKNRLKSFLLKLLVAVTGVMLIALREDVGEKISEALTLCADVLIPSLFPFMVLSSFALSLGIFEKNSRIMSFVMSKLFRLPSAAVSAVLFGFVGGYPVGARVILSLYEKGSISRDDARHLFAFCVNAGPAFIVSVAGGMIIGSVKAGYVMLFSVLLSSVIVGFVYARFKPKNNCAEPVAVISRADIADSLVSAVTGASTGILSVCAWVIAFVAFSAVVRYFINNCNILLLYESLSEVTSGLVSATKIGGIPFASACIAFGGVSVACQLLPAIKKCGIKVGEYLLFRIANSILSYIITSVMMKFVQISVPTLSQYQAQLHFAPASAALLIMCAVLIFDLSSQKQKQLKIFG